PYVIGIKKSSGFLFQLGKILELEIRKRFGGSDKGEVRGAIMTL
ncbi:uncharacterized, partial [Tachysurus ichikawai]